MGNRMKCDKCEVWYIMGQESEECPHGQEEEVSGTFDCSFCKTFA